jgi:hypothetical protein
VWIASGRAFEPFLGAKIAMLSIPLIAGRRIWLGALLVLLFLTESMVLYSTLHMASMRDRITLGEPWTTFLFALFALGYLVVREQRRIASVRLLRAEAASFALHRQAMLLLAVRDQINSPLQTLIAGVEVLPRGEPVERVRVAIDQLASIGRELTDFSQGIRPPETLSFDATFILAPKAQPPRKGAPPRTL